MKLPRFCVVTIFITIHCLTFATSRNVGNHPKHGQSVNHRDEAGPQHKAHNLAELPMSNNNQTQLWALLVAGSNGYYNYRHQADVCHAYQVLLKHGLKPENIITMMYDDIANSTE